ncbi:protein-tyrosine phosphatase [Ophiocordyceps camponoti-floridani]|uniref:Protein-tyrosine phosphatase n=1 Tax=Ophiocordyceps camponoti-floridani TaxID=2030778 RepID=A0A8H4Q575_9HYPO|nr:protein-tyrosine phosphatase [Ophiocordyceps camponoti-floridani]
MRPSILYALLALIKVSQSRNSTSHTDLIRRYENLQHGQEDGCFPSGHGFSRFTWVTEHLLETDKLARSSAPHYSCDDSSQRLNDESIRFLQGKGIGHVISLNSLADDKTIVDKLVENNIKYTAIPVPDLASLSMGEMMKAISFFISEPQRPTLIWCGYGHGRTGTLVTAIQMFRLRQMEKPLQLDHDDYMKNHVETQSQRSLLDVYQFTLNAESDYDFKMRVLVGDYYLSFATALKKTESLKKTLFTKAAENMSFQTIVNLVRETAWTFQVFQRFSALTHELAPETMKLPVIRRPEKEVVQAPLASNGDDFLLQLNALIVEVGTLRAHIARYKEVAAPCEALRDMHDLAANFVNSKVKTLVRTAKVMRTNLAHKYFHQLASSESKHGEMNGVETNVISKPLEIDGYDRDIKMAERVARRMSEVETFNSGQPEVTATIWKKKQLQRYKTTDDADQHELEMNKEPETTREDSSGDSMAPLHPDSDSKTSSEDLKSLEMMQFDSETDSDSDTITTMDSQITVVPARKTAAEKASVEEEEEEEGFSADSKVKMSGESDSNMWNREAIERWRQSVALAEPENPVTDQEFPDQADRLGTAKENRMNAADEKIKTADRAQNTFKQRKKTPEEATKQKDEAHNQAQEKTKIQEAGTSIAMERMTTRKQPSKSSEEVKERGGSQAGRTASFVGGILTGIGSIAGAKASSRITGNIHSNTRKGNHGPQPGSSPESRVAALEPITAPIEVSSEETLALMEEVLEEAILEALKQLPPLPSGPIGDATIGGREKVALLSRSISALHETERTEDEMRERAWKVRVLAPVVERILHQTLSQTLDRFERQIALQER